MEWKAKYSPLSEYLAASGSESVTLKIEEIEAILGFPLPKSASYRAFWENSGHVQSQARVSAGYATKVELAKKMIVFKKTDFAPLSTVESNTSKSFEGLAREALRILWCTA